MDHQPGDKRTELRWSEQVDFEHGDGVRADGTVEEGVDSELGDLLIQHAIYSGGFNT